MITLLLLIIGSIGIVLAAERHPTTRYAMQKLARAYSPGTCRSFILDILILLPLVGLLVETIAKRTKSQEAIRMLMFITAWALFLPGYLSGNIPFVMIGLGLYLLLLLDVSIFTFFQRFWLTIRQALYTTAFSIFLAIAGSLYFDLFNFSFLTLLLGHPEAWGGNHFMWNSGIEVLGLKPIVDTIIPTYQNFWKFWNLLALLLLGPVYLWIILEPRTWILIRAYTRLHGLFFGYTPKQTGISALFFERKTH